MSGEYYLFTYIYISVPNIDRSRTAFIEVGEWAASKEYLTHEVPKFIVFDVLLHLLLHSCQGNCVILYFLTHREIPMSMLHQFWSVF